MRIISPLRKQIKVALKIGILTLVTLISLLSIDLSTKNEAISVKFSPINLNTEFGPRDHESIYRVDDALFIYGGFYRASSVYQELLQSNDYGESWNQKVGLSDPRLNDLVSPSIYLNGDLPSGYARPQFWNSKQFLVDKDLWLQKSNTFVKVAENFLPGLLSASELSILYTKTGLVFIELSSGKIWEFDNDMSPVSIRELNFEGEILKVRGAAVFENHGRFFIYGGEVVNRESDNYLKINPLNLISIDGVNWMPIESLGRNQSRVPFSNLIWGCIVNDARERTWVLSGYNPQNLKNSREVFVSNDGFKFERVKTDAEEKKYFPRHAPGCIYLEENNSILVVGGKGSRDENNNNSWVLNETWRLKLP